MVTSRRPKKKKKFRQSKFPETVATVAISHFSFYYALPFFKREREKKQSLLSEKNINTFNVLLWIYFIFRKGPSKPYNIYPRKFHQKKLGIKSFSSVFSDFGHEQKFSCHNSLYLPLYPTINLRDMIFCFYNLFDKNFQNF